MKSLRSLFLLVLLGLVSVAGAAPESFRLDRLGIVRFSTVADGRLQRFEGTLHLDGRVSDNARGFVDRPANLPAEYLDRPLVSREAWFAYRALGFGATANFRLGIGSAAVTIGGTQYWVAEVEPEARFADGSVINVSTRARLAGAGERVTAGFVIEGRARWVLIRGVGPALAAFGVAAPLADPYLTLRKGTLIQYFNDNWYERPDAEALRAASLRVGAFPLPEGGKDAALLVELQPGAYTVSVESAAPVSATGELLVEVYRVPDPQFD